MERQRTDMARSQYVLADGQPCKIDAETTAADLKRVLDTKEDAVGICELQDGRRQMVLDDHRVMEKVPPNQEIVFREVVDLTRDRVPCPECGGRVEFEPGIEEEQCTACGTILFDRAATAGNKDDGDTADEPGEVAAEGLGELFG